jgi:glycosyltransferase involved in cell wall biosynthesis
MDRNLKIAHLSSAHPRDDQRILTRQCVSLARAGHDVHLVVADGRGAGETDGVRIHDTGCPTGRLERAVLAARRVAAAAAALRPDIVQLHDPELLPQADRLRRAGARVIYDAHEDLPRQTLSKPYLAPPVARGVSAAAARYLAWIAPRLDGIVAATPHIAAQFAALNPQTVTVRNYPRTSHLPETPDWPAGGGGPVYTGGISEQRGVGDLVRALELTAAAVPLLDLYGAPVPATYLDALRARPGWARVRYHGHVPHAEVTVALRGAGCGLAVLHPTEAYMQALPVKLFEYMAAAIPVIVSDFPLWREIVAGAGCGRTVPPGDPAALAAALDWMAGHPDAARAMGRAGYDAVRTRLNWEAEEARLLAFYSVIGAR